MEEKKCGHLMRQNDLEIVLANNGVILESGPFSLYT